MTSKSTYSHVIDGPLYKREIFASLGELILLLVRMHHDTVLQIDAVTGEKLRGKLLLNRAISIAKWLQENDMKPGDCISLSSENSLEYCLIPAAAFMTGVTIAPLNPEYTPGEQKHIINLSKPKIIFCSPKTIDQIISGKENYPYVEKFVLLGKNSRRNDVVLLHDIIKDANTECIDEEFKATPVNPDECVAVVFSSSGTTGLPKGVMTTHFNIIAFMEISRQIQLSDNEEEGGGVLGRIGVGVTPFFHSMGFIYMFLLLLAGKTLIVYPKFDPKLFLESIAKYRVTTLVIPPPIILFLVKHPMVINYDLSSIKELRCGAAPLSKELENEVTKKLNAKSKCVSQSYGLTETTLGVLLSQGNVVKLGSVGNVVPGMKCKVIDANGIALGPNKQGELCFKGPLVMKGYANNLQATKEAIDQDNWLHTGDIGYYDQDRYFFIVDRIKELIKYKGFQVAPAELEALLMTHSAVLDAAVVGLEDESAGELPLAYVVKRSTANVTAEDLEKYVAEKVSPSKHLHGGVRFIKKIPRNPSGKILRRTLREHANTVQSKL